MFEFFRGGSTAPAATTNNDALEATEPTTRTGTSCGAPVCLFNPDGQQQQDIRSSSPITGETVELICEDTLESWCKAHGLTLRHLDILQALGTTTYLDFFEMNHEDKQSLMRGLNLELVQKNRFLAAVEPESLALFYESTDKRLPVNEYHLRSNQRLLRKLKKTPLLEMGASSSSSSSSESTRDWFPPSIHVPPHKIVVVDRTKREKAMHDNPTITANDFLSFRTDTLRLPLGGTVKVILVVGRHGTGKSAVINSFVNHLYGIHYEDNHRVQLVMEPNNNNTKRYHRPQRVSTTDQVTGYLLEAPPGIGGKDWVLLVDTPGFEDGRGLEHNEAIVDEIKSFFTNEIKYVNAIWFVNQSNDMHHTVTQKWMYENINSLFLGRDEDTTSLLFTFCDTEEPPALDGMENVGIHSNKFFKLNNSGFILKDVVETSEIESTLNMMFWDMSNNSFRSLVELLQKSNECPLATGQKRKTALRIQLGKSIEHAWREAEEGICKLISLEQTIPLIVRARSRIENNRFEVETLKYLRVRTRKTESGCSIICDSCQCTCVDNCDVAANEGEDSAPVLTAEGLGGYYCKSCPAKCHLSNHRYVDQVWDLKECKLHKKIKDLKHRYVKDSSGKRSEFEQIMSGMRAEFHKIQNDVYDQVKLVQDMLSELQEGALTPEQFLSEYAGLLSKQEDVKDRKRVWKWRLGVLENGAKYIDKIAGGSLFDPFDEKFSALIAEAAAVSPRNKSIQLDKLKKESSISSALTEPGAISQE